MLLKCLILLLLCSPLCFRQGKDNPNKKEQTKETVSFDVGILPSSHDAMPIINATGKKVAWGKVAGGVKDSMVTAMYIHCRSPACIIFGNNGYLTPKPRDQPA